MQFQPTRQGEIVLYCSKCQWTSLGIAHPVTKHLSSPWFHQEDIDLMGLILARLFIYLFIYLLIKINK